MTNHYHLLLKTPLANLSHAMRHLNSLYTRRFNKLEGRDGPLFRGRYKSIVISGFQYLLQVSRYIHLNPVEAGIVKKSDDYLWSSCRSYYSDAKSYPWLSTQKLLGYFQDQSCRIKYKKYVEHGTQQDDLKELYQNKTPPSVIGSDQAKLLLDRMAKKSLCETDEISGLNSIRSKDSIEIILQVVAQYYKRTESDLFRKKTRPGNQPRSLVMYLARYKNHYKLNEIASFFGNISYSSVSVSISRLKKQLQKNNSLRKDLDNLKKILDR